MGSNLVRNSFNFHDHTSPLMPLLHHCLMTIYEEEVELGRDYHDKSEQEMEVVDDDHDMKINKGCILMPMMTMIGLYMISLATTGVGTTRTACTTSSPRLAVPLSMFLIRTMTENGVAGLEDEVAAAG
ncbi:Hypothetical predicted protein [Prunus dulcis]|uniref:Uncharacterized protein n=1 Tax=Prunus dulcis TaxID=3755 RepID=A0A5E4FH62_PRUDU|nr:Hypothetical predicted protein [Prunus dulcis]